MSIVYKTGDLLKQIPRNKLIIVPHVCNNVGGWGKGFVMALSNKWHPKDFAHDINYSSPEESYRYMYEQYQDNSEDFPRGIDATICWGHPEKDIWIANMIAQNGTIGSHNPYPLRYPWLKICMQKVSQTIEDTQTIEDNTKAKIPIEIHSPKFGCGLAGGDWKKIEKLIEEIWCPLCLVFVYEF